MASRGKLSALLPGYAARSRPVSGDADDDAGGTAAGGEEPRAVAVLTARSAAAVETHARRQELLQDARSRHAVGVVRHVWAAARTASSSEDSVAAIVRNRAAFDAAAWTGGTDPVPTLDLVLHPAASNAQDELAIMRPSARAPRPLWGEIRSPGAVSVASSPVGSTTAATATARKVAAAAAATAAAEPVADVLLFRSEQRGPGSQPAWLRNIAWDASLHLACAADSVLLTSASTARAGSLPLGDAAAASAAAASTAATLRALHGVLGVARGVASGPAAVAHDGRISGGIAPRLSRRGNAATTQTADASATPPPHSAPAYDAMLNSIGQQKNDGGVQKEDVELMSMLPSTVNRFLRTQLNIRNLCHQSGMTRVTVNAKLARESSGGAAAGASVLAAGGMSSPSGTSGTRVGSSFHVRRRDDLSAREGPLVLLEYMEQHPPLLSALGMGSRIVRYQRFAASDTSSSTTAASASSATPAAAPAFAPHVEVLETESGYPLLGGLPSGEAQTVLRSTLFDAPLAAHVPKRNTFLLVLRSERAAPSTSAAAAALMHAPTPASSSTGAVRTRDKAAAEAAAAAPSAGPRGKRLPVLYLRPIEALYTVGQLEPRVRIFRPVPGTNRARNAATVDEQTRKFLQHLFCHALLHAFRKSDDEYTAQQAKVTAAAAAQGKGVATVIPTITAMEPGLLRVADVLWKFKHFFEPHGWTLFVELIGDVARYDQDRALLRRRDDAPAPEDYRDTVGLQPDHVCAYEAMLAGEELLRRAGLRVLRQDEKAVEDALRRLHELYSAMVLRLRKQAGAETSAMAAGGDDDLRMWETDGGFQRMRRTLDILLTIYCAMIAPAWCTSGNLLAFRAGDPSAIAVRDVEGVGDPSGGRGESFSFIREFSRHRLFRTPGATVGKREGTDLDRRALTNAVMAEMLLGYGYSEYQISRMERWQRVAAIRDVQNEQASMRGGTDAVAASQALAFTGESKLNTSEKMKIKNRQAQEVAQRQRAMLAAGSSTAPAASAAMDVDGDDTDEDELAGELGRAITEKWKNDPTRAGTLAEEVQRRELETVKEMMKAKAGASRDPSATLGERKRLPVPDELLRPPRAPLLASAWAEGGSALKTETVTRPGARNPQHLGSLNEPPPLPRFNHDNESNQYSAQGRVVRIVRTTVDSDGKQVVRVTYSTNPYVVKQLWLRQRHGIDLGALGMTGSAAKHAARAEAIDAEGKGLVSTGIFPSPQSAALASRLMVRDREQELVRLRSDYHMLRHTGMVMDGVIPGQRDRDHELKSATRIIMHGIPVEICSACRVWGHKKDAPLCPASGAAPTSEQSKYVIMNNASNALDGPQRVTAGARRPRKADGTTDGGPTKRGRYYDGDDDDDVITSADVVDDHAPIVGSMPAMPVAAPVVRRVANRNTRDAPAFRQWCELLEGVIVDLMRDPAYAVFSVPPDLVALRNYSTIVKQPMDLSTIRRKIVTREYTSIEAVDADLALIASNSLKFNGATSITKVADTLVKSARSAVRNVNAKLRLHWQNIHIDVAEIRAWLDARFASARAIAAARASEVAAAVPPSAAMDEDARNASVAPAAADDEEEIEIVSGAV